MEAVTPEMHQALEDLVETIGIWQQDILNNLSEHEIEVWVQYAVMGKGHAEIGFCVTQRWDVVNAVSSTHVQRILASAQLKIIKNVVDREDAQEFLAGKPELQACLARLVATLEEQKPKRR